MKKVWADLMVQREKSVSAKEFKGILDNYEEFAQWVSIV